MVCGYHPPEEFSFMIPPGMYEAWYGQEHIAFDLTVNLSARRVLEAIRNHIRVRVHDVDIFHDIRPISATDIEEDTKDFFTITTT